MLCTNSVYTIYIRRQECVWLLRQSSDRIDGVPPGLIHGVRNPAQPAV